MMCPWRGFFRGLVYFVRHSEHCGGHHTTTTPCRASSLRSILRGVVVPAVTAWRKIDQTSSDTQHWPIFFHPTMTFKPKLILVDTDTQIYQPNTPLHTWHSYFQVDAILTPGPTLRPRFMDPIISATTLCGNWLLNLQWPWDQPNSL